MRVRDGNVHDKSTGYIQMLYKKCDMIAKVRGPDERERERPSEESH